MKKKDNLIFISCELSISLVNSSIWIFVIFFFLFVGTLHIEEYYSFVIGVAKILPNFFFNFTQFF